MEQAGYTFQQAQVQYIPQTDVLLTDEKGVAQMNKLIEHLEDSDDVQSVWHNWEGEE